MENKKSMYLPKASCFSKTTRYQQISPASSIGRACDFVSLPFSNHQLQNNSLTVRFSIGFTTGNHKVGGSTPPSGILSSNFRFQSELAYQILFFFFHFSSYVFFLCSSYYIYPPCYSIPRYPCPKFPILGCHFEVKEQILAYDIRWIDGQTGPTCM